MLQLLLIVLFLGIGAFGIKHYLYFRKYRTEKELHQLAQMNRRDFEIYIAESLKKKGRKNIKVGKGVKDGGVDVSGKYQGEKRIVQCKRYKKNGSIGVKVVREIFGVAKSKDANALIVSTGRFTKAAREFAVKNNIQLWGGLHLI